MRYTPGITPPRTGSSPRFSTTEFDSTLPPEALDELLKRRRPRRRPPAVSRRVLILLAWLGAPVLLIALLCVLLSVSGWQPASRGSLETQRIARAALDRVSIPAAPVTTPAVRTPVVQTPVAALIGRDPVVRRALPAAPRAELVSLPVRRASIVRWPAATYHQ
jgi:hypothetical protein